MKPNQLTSLRQLANSFCARTNRSATRLNSLIVILVTFMWLALSGYLVFAAINDGQERWQVGSRVGEPSARADGSAIWTGSEMIVWGGTDDSATFNTGGRYHPAAYRWTALPTNGAPAARMFHTAIWTGSEMIIWGGTPEAPLSASSRGLNTGARYNPVANTWTPVSTNGAPSQRLLHAAVWTGSEMLVWGGFDGASSIPSTGARYNPSSDTWTEIATNGAPSARNWHQAVWTGTEMLVWGGYDGSSTVNTGGRYNPALNTWTAITTSNAPSPRYVHAAVWTGRDMIVWGGYAIVSSSSSVNTGGRYDPLSDTWTAVTTMGAPSARGADPLTAIWTGNEMIIWGGWNGSSTLNTGGLYNPTANTWRAMTLTDAPLGRVAYGAVWTGEVMIIFGGYSYPSNMSLSDTFLYGPPSECSIPPQNLVAWWPGNGDANDIMGTNHGTLHNGATFAPGMVGQAFSLDGIDDFVEVPNFIRDYTNFTFLLWMKIESLTDQYYMAPFCQFGPNPQHDVGFALYCGYDPGISSFGFYAYDGNRSIDLRSNLPFGTGVWKHVAVTYDGTTVKQYLDAVLLNQATAPGFVLGNDLPMLIGKGYAYPNGALVTTYFDGQVDELAVFNRALDSNEIATIYAAGSVGMCAPDVPPCSNCPPSIVTQPISQTIFVADSASFNVAASGTAPLSYQWLKDDVAIPGATSASSQIVNAQTNDAGHYSVLVTNLYGSATSSNATLTVLARVDSFTELFDAGDNDLAFSTLAFTPDGSASFYAACHEAAIGFPTDPTGGTLVPLTDDSFVQVTLSGANTVSLYGRRTNVFFIGSNGYVTLNRGDNNPDESLANHFNLPRISALFHDLDPEAGGTISWKQMPDRVAVTYIKVPEYGNTSPNSFQIEMFADGRIRLTYLVLNSLYDLVGLSAGLGVPARFQESDLSSYGPCVIRPPGPAIALAQPMDTYLADGGTKDFGNVTVGSGNSLIFTVRNFGTADLTGLAITVDGLDAAMFNVAANPVAPVSPGGSTSFTVHFTPASAGVKTSALHIASDDSNEDPFNILLQGTATYTTGPGAVFTDWTAIDTSSKVARGTLDGVSVTLSGGDLIVGVTDGTFAGFDAPYFTPRLAASDMIEFSGNASTQRYTVSFGAPVRDPILLLHSLGSVLTFDTTNITRLNGESVFTVSGATVTGNLFDNTGHDANGSVQLRGVFTSFSFTAYSPFGVDGIDLQIVIEERSAEYCWRASWGVSPDQVDPSMSYVANPSNLVPAAAADGLLLQTDNSQDPGGTYYTQAMYYIQTELTMPGQLVIEAELRVVSGFTQPDAIGRAPLYIVFNTAPSVGGVLCIRPDVVFLSRGPTDRLVEAAVGTDDSFHLYRIEVDNPTTVTADGQVRVYLDGKLIMTSLLENSGFDVGPTPEIFFGYGGSHGYGTSIWRMFRHNASSQPSRPIMSLRASSEEVCWTSCINTLYNLQYCSDLRAPIWLNLFTNVVGNGDINCVIDPQPRIELQKYYRVEVLR